MRYYPAFGVLILKQGQLHRKNYVWDSFCWNYSYRAAKMRTKLERIRRCLQLFVGIFQPI